MIYLILHGSFGYPDENWFPWLKLKLEKEGHKVYSPQLPIDDFDKLKPRDSPKQNLKAWLKSIEDIIIDSSIGRIAQILTKQNVGQSGVA